MRIFYTLILILPTCFSMYVRKGDEENGITNFDKTQMEVTQNIENEQNRATVIPVAVNGTGTTKINVLHGKEIEKTTSIPNKIQTIIATRIITPETTTATAIITPKTTTRIATEIFAVENITPKTTTMIITPQTTTRILTPKTTTEMVTRRISIETVTPKTTTSIIYPKTTTRIRIIYPETTTGIITEKTTTKILTEDTTTATAIQLIDDESKGVTRPAMVVAPLRGNNHEQFKA